MYGLMIFLSQVSKLILSLIRSPGLPGLSLPSVTDYAPALMGPDAVAEFAIFYIVLTDTDWPGQLSPLPNYLSTWWRIDKSGSSVHSRVISILNAKCGCLGAK